MSIIPEELRYTREHEWIKVENDTGLIGITDYAQRQMADIVFIELPEKGRIVEQGKSLSTIETVKSVSEIFAPVSGEIIEINEKLRESPEIINSDCYGQGW